MRRLVSSAVVLVLVTSSLAAQGLRERISELFIFTAGKDPLFLGGTADPNNPATIQLHADHFIPAARAENGSLISFLSNAVSGNVANIPVSATSGGSTFRFEGGVPVRTSVSPGPVFAERAQTLGRGRVFVGANVNHLHFATLRGVSLDGIELTFTHENVTGPVCDSIVGASCTPYGVPMLENDVIAVRLALDLDMTVTSFFMSFGLLDRVDVGVVLPIVSTSLHGTSDAEIVPFGGTTAAHFWGGTPANPQLSTSRLVEGSATLAADLVSEFQVGESKLRLAGTVTYDAPFRRMVEPTNIPTERDDQINGSFGFKFATGAGITLVANTQWPLNRGGLRPNLLWTAGLEYNF